MNQFLDQLLNNPPTKKRTLTETNSEIVKKNSEQQRIQQLIELQRNDSQPGLNSSGEYRVNIANQQNSSGMSQDRTWKLPQDESSEYEVEEVTEQILFDEDGAQTTAQKLRLFLPQVRESLPQMQASRQQSDEEVLESYSPLQHAQNASRNPNYYNHASNRRTSTEPQQYEMNRSPSSSLARSQLRCINSRTVENLVNGINNAKASQVELAKWFQLQKQSFYEYVSTVMVKIQLQIKKVLEKSNLSKKPEVSLSAISLNEELRQSIREELKQQLVSEFQQQKISSQKSQLNSLPSESSLSNDKKWQIQKKLIKEELEQRYQYRLEKLQQELDQQRKYSEQLIKTYQESHKPSTIKSSSSFNGKGALSEVDQEIIHVRKQLQARDKTINDLEIQIQRLNEHIFDVEQQVEGIQLEVENKVREKVKVLEIEHQKTIQELKNNLSYQINNSYNEFSPITELNPILESSSHLEQSTRYFGLQSNHQPSHMLQQMTELQLQNQQLKKIIAELQNQKSSIELQLKEQENLINFREEQIKKNQEDIAFEWAEMEKQREQRQRSIVTAEENISAQISKIRAKQMDLDRWETELQKRQLALDLRQHEINQKLEQIVHQTNLQKQHQTSVSHKEQIQRFSHEVVSNNSNHKMSRGNLNDFHTEGGGSFRPNGVEIPELPIGKKYHEVDSIKQEKSYDHDYNYRTKPQEIVSKTNFEKSFEDADRSYTRQNRSRERMIVTSTNYRSNRVNPNAHQFVLPQSSKVQRHSRSKSRSKEKNMLRNGFSNGSSSISANTYKTPSHKGTYMDNYYQNKQTSNLDGLGSKLQRLRDEIKREIDSIK